MDLFGVLLGLLVAGVLRTHAAMDLPKFRQMVLLYPGYYLHGGRYRDHDVITMIGGHFTAHMHNTASLRLSWMLNRCGGQHAIGKTPVNLSKHGNDSYTGRDRQQYIFRNTAYGPFLASRYGNPLLTRTTDAQAEVSDAGSVMAPFLRKQGIARLVSYRRSHAGGHVALWDCDHFVQSRDWSKESHVIAAELWEAPDSYCPPLHRLTPQPHLVTLSPERLAVRLRQHDPVQTRHNRRHTPREAIIPALRHYHHHQGHRRANRRTLKRDVQ